MYKHLFRATLWLMGIMGTLALGVVNAQEVNKDIVLEATSTAANQKLKINKYFANDYTVSRCEGCEAELLSSDTIHTYATAGTYTITLSLAGGADRWTFQDVYKPLVPTNGTTMTGVKITYMPSLEEGFGASATSPGNYFFSYFNNNGKITSLPTGSFDISNIISAGDNFFSNFNQNGKLTSLPTGSFKLATGLTTAGDYFFSAFNQNGKLTSLPTGSFDTSKITTAGDNFFSSFNSNGQLTSLPTGSFDTSKITTAGFYFFYVFNSQGQLTSLPTGSFKLATGLTTAGDNFFSAFNQDGKLTSLPIGSFDTSKITTAGNNFFSHFNRGGQLTSLPTGSFDLSNITTAGTSFFSNFNAGGQLTSLPTGSFDTSKITTAGDYFFYVFNYNGRITNLPDSFKLTSAAYAYNKTNRYQNSFNSSSYTFNRKVSDLVSGITPPTSDRNTFSDNQPGRCGVHANWLVSTANACSISYDDGQGGTGEFKYAADTTGVVAGSGMSAPTRAGYIFDGWTNASGDIVEEVTFPEMDGETLYAKWRGKDIILQATSTAANQKIRINKYFSNAYTVDWGDGTTGNLTADTTHTYSTAGTYTITLSLAGGADRWTFQNVSKPLVPKNGTTMTGVQITSMPSLEEGFGVNATAPGNYFFSSFNSQGALTSLPTGSFDTSKITTAGNDFFSSFNYRGQLTSLPTGSFDTSKITTAGTNFFSSFNSQGQLTSLPTGSFDTSKITTAGDNFFFSFNYYGQLTSLPTGSFDTSKITTAGTNFFSSFNYRGQLTSLPTGSFDTSKITTAGDYFFSSFNYYGQLTSLPEGSFDTSKITTAGDNFFSVFNYYGKLTSLPTGSFDTSKITTAGDFFFSSFNNYGQLTSLPTGSFDTSKITTAGDNFFYCFNRNGQLTSLPTGSFDTSKITTAGDNFFSSFNYRGQLTSLPTGSFDTSKITTAGDSFFSYFNYNGKITTLPESFKLTSAAYDKTDGYQNSFNSSSYTFNRKVSDLVSGITVPSSDRNTFSDNQPGRCGVHENWLVTTADACSISYDDGQGGTGEVKYNADVTGAVVGSGFTLPTLDGYVFEGWYTASGERIDEVIFPDMDGQTLYAQWTPIDYEIEYELNDGVISGENVTGYTIESDDITLINPTKTGYTFTGRSGTNIGGLSIYVTIVNGSTGDRNYEANREINQYTITIDVDGNITTITGDYGSPITPPSDPSKNGYKFIGWDPEIPATMPAEDVEVKATWEKLGSSGGGGGSNKSSSDVISNDSEKSTEQKDGDTGMDSSAEPQNDNQNAQDSQQAEQASDKVYTASSASEGQNQGKTYSEEFQEAYNFAHSKGITTMPTIQSAQMDGKLTRIAMAKMLSQYAINVLGQKPANIITPKFNDVTEKMDSDYDDGVTLAYQLGIMGINMPNNKFRPNDEVTRGEFVTALSRMLYNTSDGEYRSTPKYYTHHMEKMEGEGIITNTDPNMKELRGYVMIMLMRSVK